MSIFSKTNVYHSWLANKSPLVVQFTSEPQQSKFNDNYFVWFKVRGDDDPEASYCYTIETPDIMETIKGTKKTLWYKGEFTANATESKDMAGNDKVEYEQLLSLEEAGEAPLATFVKKDGQKVVAVSSMENAPNLVLRYNDCLAAALGIVGAALAFTDLEVEEGEMVQRIANSLFIQWGYRGFGGTLEGDDIDVDAVGNEAEGVDDAPPASDLNHDLLTLIDGLPSKSGTSHDDRQLKSAVSKIEKAAKAATEVPLEEYVKMAQWLRDEVTFQSGEGDDELPF